MMAANYSRSDKLIPELRILINFDQEKGRTPRDPNSPDTCYCTIKKSKTIRLAVIQGYLNKQMPFDSTILEAISMFSQSSPFHDAMLISRRLS